MKILITYGHGGTDPGSIGSDKEAERDRTATLGKAVVDYLNQNGHSAKGYQEKNASGKWAFVGRNGYEVAVSIHFNAFSKSATGTEALYKSPNDKALATRLSSNVSGAMGIKNRGAKIRNDLYMMNIGFDSLLEVCFHDNSSDLAKYNANFSAVVKAIGDGIMGYAGSPPAPQPVPQPSPSASRTVESVAQEIAKGVGGWGNGATRVSRVRAAGLDHVVVQSRVNEILGAKTSKPNKKTNAQIAQEVIRGHWGNGEARKKKLKAAGYDPIAIQKIVNRNM